MLEGQSMILWIFHTSNLMVGLDHISTLQNDAFIGEPTSLVC